MSALRIAIIELYEHWEVVQYLSRALCNHELEFWLTEGVAEHPALATLDDVHRFAVQEREQAALHLARRAGAFDAIIVCTRIADHRPWKALALTVVPQVLLLHDAAFSFSASPQLLQDWRSRLRRARWRLNGDWVSRRLAHQSQWRGFVTSAPGGEDYLRSTGESRPCLVTPYAIAPMAGAQMRPLLPDDTELRLALPGSIDDGHRDYATIIRALTDWRGRRLQVSLPGVMRGGGAKEVLRGFAGLASDRLTVQSIQKCPNLDYPSALIDAHALLMPVRRTVYYATQLEHVGVTKGLGALDDQFRYRKPAIVPEGIVTWPELSAATQRYSSAFELRRLLDQYEIGLPSEVFAPFTAEVLGAKWTAFLRRCISN